jgi:hypothetical protein
MKVHVKNITKTWLPEGHDGEIRYTGCAEHLCVPFDTQTRKLMTGLEKEDEVRLEKVLKLPEGTLSPYNNDYWGDYKRTIRIDKNGIVLDIDNPKDEIIYKNLLVHPEVANSEEELDSEMRPYYKYVITSEEGSAKVKNERFKIKRDAYKLFAKTSIENMKNFLKIYGKRVDDSATLDFIESEISEIIEKDPQAFIDVMSDKDFDMKTFVLDCIYIRSITKKGPKYMLTGGDQIGMSIEETINYLNDPMNQDVYLSLKARLETKKK